jgi:hypothetical protein
LFSSHRQDHEAAALTSAQLITRSHRPAPAPLQLTARNAAALLGAVGPGEQGELAEYPEDYQVGES